MSISEYLELLSSHDVPGAFLVVTNEKSAEGNDRQYFGFMCPCENEDIHETIKYSRYFEGVVRRSTLKSIVSQGYVLQSTNVKPGGLYMWTFTKPRPCPSCSGTIAEC